MKSSILRSRRIFCQGRVCKNSCKVAISRGMWTSWSWRM